MNTKFYLALLFATTLMFAQTNAQTISQSEMDSLMCPFGKHALGEPYVQFKIANGNSAIDNQTLKGKVVLINFWFEGCHPCMAEMAALNDLYKKMSDNKDFLFISITWDNDETIARVKNKFGLQFEVFAASSMECSRLNYGCGYPTSLILDKSGIIRFKHNGGSVKEKEAREFVGNILFQEIQSLF